MSKQLKIIGGVAAVLLLIGGTAMFADVGADARAPRMVSLGCRLNAYESEVMRAHARAAGLGDAIIVNTCAVTKEAERQSVQVLRRLRRENPNAHVVAAGCASYMTIAR